MTSIRLGIAGLLPRDPAAFELATVELGHYHTSLISPEPSERAENLRAVWRACQVAAHLGRPPVIIGSGSLFLKVYEPDILNPAMQPLLQRTAMALT